MTKIKSGFFDNFSVDMEDEMSDTSKPTTETTDTGAEVVKDSKEQFEDTDEDEEDKETVEPDKVKEKEETQEPEDEEGEDPFIATINHLAEKGLIEFDEDKEYEEEGEDLLNVVFQETLEKRYQKEFVDAIPEEYQSIFKHMKAGKPLDEWVDAVKLIDFDSINMEDEDNQKQLIEDHLALTGMDDEDIKERIQELEDLGTLGKASKIAVKYLKKDDEAKAKAYESELDSQIERQRQRDDEALEDFKKTVLSTEDLKGFKLTDKKERQELLDYILKPTNNKGESKYVQESKSIENQIALAYMSMKGFSFKDIQKAAETKVSGNLRKSLSNFTDKNAKSLGGATGRVATESRKLPTSGPWATSTDIEE